VIVGLSDSYIKTITFGLGDLSAVRRVVGIQGAIDKDSAAYRGGVLLAKQLESRWGPRLLYVVQSPGSGGFVLLLGLELPQGK
jgi:hypothetical protein